MAQRLPVLYTFIDEGGNLDFSAAGTRFFTLTSVTMARPFPLELALSELRCDLLEEGIVLERFHATTDKQATRDRVFQLICGQLHRFRVDSVIVEKSKTGPALREFEEFYPRMMGYLLQYLVRGTDWTQWSELVVIADRLAEKRRRKALEKAVRTTLKNTLPPGTRYRIYHHESQSHYGLQIADYFNWAIYRKWTDGDRRSYEPVARRIVSEFDIFRTGVRHYY